MFEITEKEKCVGCGACANACPAKCIEMIEDETQGGFLYPNINEEKCLKCGLCKKVCPVNNPPKVMIDRDMVYACINKDEDVRGQSTSGGVFYLLAREILKDGGVVFGVTYTEDMDVVHRYITDINEIQQFMGSKYVQSNIGNTYSECLNFLKEGKKVLFSGTPCQIAGLKNYLKKDYDNLICHDLICHGVPANYAWKKYIKYVEKKYGKKVVDYKFRSKYKGWNRCGVEIKFADDTCKFSYLNKESYTQIFLDYANLRSSCYECQFRGGNRASDITLADFWGVEKVIPEKNDDKGISLAIINTDKGKEIFEQISQYIDLYQVEKEVALRQNSSYYKSANKASYRDKLVLNTPKYSWRRLLYKCGMKGLIKAEIKRILKPMYVRIKRVLKK